ncbi:hypothetical protein [Litorivivens sp.]|uniref:hypothetical protein n=1 Tax=Litorivivens sp. TaxID=2020868 RepID=UPI00356A27C7
MAYGDHPNDKVLRDSWQEFCRRLEQAGEQVFKDHNPATDLHRADAMRFLMQNVGQAFDLGFETRDPAFPTLHAFCTPNCKLGGDAADFTYHQAWISGDYVYRVTGQRGTARFINFTVQGERPETQPGTDIPSLHEPFGDIPEANLFGHDLTVESDGSFELFIGGERRGRNWLPVTAKTRKLFIRQGFDGWDELPAKMSIERIGMNEPRPLPTTQTLCDGIHWAGDFIEGVMRDWPDHPYQYSPFVDLQAVNQFPSEQGGGADEDKRRGRAVASLCWELAPEQALLITFMPPDSFWMAAQMGVFFNSMDFWYRPVSYTPARTVVDSDGKVRLIISHRDPGYHNWLDTQGFVRGNLCYRNLLSTAATDFETRVVACNALPDVMPQDSIQVTPQERQLQMQTRFDSIRQRYGF